MVLIISSQTVVARADKHQLHMEDVSFMSIDEHGHVIGGPGVIYQPESAEEIANADMPQVDCEHGHIHISAATFLTASLIIPEPKNHASLRITLEPLLQIGIHTLPFRPPIS